ncbi:MAG TPA: DUF1800 domain-containing protein [Thermoanaerobaculia bacterium]|nr:DUF1800 domain-containing protein [Thermoanaerobaculia bacterium]
MKVTLRTATAAALVLCAAWAGAAAYTQEEKPLTVHMPWKQAGLTERQAAAHLLNRFAFGPRPGEVDAVVKMGLDRWLERQLGANLPDDKVRNDLQVLPALAMSTDQILQTYPPVGMVLRQAKEAGVIPDDIKPGDLKKKADEDRREVLKEKVKAFAAEKGYRPEKELLGQLMTQKLVRAVESENQLEEVMTDFWFNHFNVSLTDNKARPFLLSYERDAIRPHALGSFRDLLEATAKSPAMLVYLDNAQSTAAENEPTTMQDEMGRRPRQRARLDGGFGGRGPLGMRRPPAQGAQAANDPQKRVRPRGVNENYARELMELHTLGVDGGYTQQDVIEVARAFTGWTILPVQPKVRETVETRLARAERAGGLGFRREGDFLFRADAHDAAPKKILGNQFPAGRGIEDGEAVLDLLAAQKATARHISTKLAVRFVSDHPPQALIDRLTGVYLATHGDIRRMIVAIAESPEFWGHDAVGSKIKSPFELTASALRATDGEIVEPRAILQWINRMGQPLYAYQAPTGYPDRAEAWVNTGSLLNRMNFGLQLAANRVKGVSLDLPALNGGREPESREQALKTYAALLMPGRDLTATLKQLTPMVADPGLAKRVDQAAPREAAKAARKADPNEDLLDGTPEMATQMPRSVKVRGMLGDEPRQPVDKRPPTPLEQVVGVILGSPEFQRR